MNAFKEQRKPGDRFKSTRELVRWIYSFSCLGRAGPLPSRIRWPDEALSDRQGAGAWLRLWLRQPLQGVGREAGSWEGLSNPGRQRTAGARQSCCRWVGEPSEGGKEAGAGWRAGWGEKEAGLGAERQSLDSSSHAGQFAASEGALWRISSLGAGLQLP